MDLEAVLATLRKYGVISAEVPGDNGAVLRVVFSPDAAPPLPPGDDLTPAGWKQSRLDADPLDDERQVP
jgi:hypothetical protein